MGDCGAVTEWSGTEGEVTSVNILRRASARANNVGRRWRRGVSRLRAWFVNHTATRADEVPVQLVFDGVDLLNWRSHDPTVRGIELAPGRGRSPFRSERRDAAGPPHGTIRLTQLEPCDHMLTARTPRGRLPVRPLPAGDGTRNVARGTDGGTWSIARDRDGRALVAHHSAGDAVPGVLSLEAAHGLVVVQVGPLRGDWQLWLEQRRADRRMLVLPRPGSTGDVYTFRLGGGQWREAQLPSTGATTVWDLVLRPESEPDRRVRLSWAGSLIDQPREALRFRDGVSRTVPGRAVRVRPYWTKDQFLALELTSSPLVEGDHL